MRKIYKTLLASALLLMLQASAAFAVSVTYSLTTHVDGRTITATANLNSGVSLLNNMPQALWRAYCTYKYYSDEALTQEITAAPVEDAIVYVDYVFDPPFTVSQDGFEQYYHSNAYISTIRYYMCGNLGARRNATDESKWAIYGDAYSLNLKNTNGSWITYNTSSPVMANSPMDIGWQLYESVFTFTSGGITYGTVALATAHNDNLILHYDNNATSPGGSSYNMGRFVLANMTGTGWSNIYWDSKHKFNHGTGSYSTNFVANSSFFFTAGSYQNIYQTTWRILQADGTWLPDIISQKGATETAIGMPPTSKFKEKTTCTYDRYYKDSEFTEKYPDNYKIPVTGNTVIYIKESYKNGEPFVTDHWITLVLSYGVNNLANEWGYAADGVTPAVRVLEYTALTTNASNTKYALTFTETDKIEAHKPYLFKADEVLEGKYINLAKDPNWGDKTQEDLDTYVGGKKVTWKDDAHNSPDVTMIGTYYDKELTVLSEHPNLLYFYFGYDKRYDSASDDYVGVEAAEGKYPYNFYRVTAKNVTMPKHRCYFMIEGAPAGAKFMLMDNFGEEISGVEGFEVERFVPTGRIYNLNGQQVGNDLEALPRGVYIVNGKKVMK